MNINFDRPPLDKETIEQKKDFSQILRQLKKPTPFYQSGWFITTAFAMAIILSVFLILNQSKKTIETSAPTNKKTPKTIVYTEDTPCVNPPKKELDIPFNTFTFSPLQKQQFKLKNATISIPANAFIDQQHQIVKDSIVLDIRILNDPIDFIVSGIPMEYDSAGFTYTFESGGMLEIKGKTIHNQPIAIDTLTSLLITFEKAKDTKDFNFYSLDTLSHKWHYISSNNLKQKTENKPPISKNMGVILQKEIESNLRQQKITNNQLASIRKEIKQEKKPIAPTPLSDANKVIALNIDKYEFPELSYFYKVKFEPIENQQTTHNIYTTQWDSKRIRQDKKEGFYQLILQKGQNIEMVTVKPVFEGKDLDVMTNKYLQKLERYNKIIKQKQEKEKLLLQKREKLLKEYKNLSEKKKNVVHLAEPTIIKILSAPITFFGTFNFDRPMLLRPKNDTPKIELETIEQPKFATTNNTPLTFEKIYVIESKRNASFSYELNKQNWFRYNPNSQISIIGFNQNKDLFFVDAKAFDSALQSNTHFVGEVLPNITLNELKLKALK